MKKEFSKWYNAEVKIHSEEELSLDQVAYAAWVEGQRQCREENIKLKNTIIHGLEALMEAGIMPETY